MGEEVSLRHEQKSHAPTFNGSVGAALDLRAASGYTTISWKYLVGVEEADDVAEIDVGMVSSLEEVDDSLRSTSPLNIFFFLPQGARSFVPKNMRLAMRFGGGSWTTFPRFEDKNTACNMAGIREDDVPLGGVSSGVDGLDTELLR